VDAAHSAGVLMQVSTEDNHAPVNPGVAGERNIAAEDQNVAAHRTVEKHVSGENPYAANGTALDVGGTEKAGGATKLFVWWEQYVPADVEWVRQRLRSSSQ
jgi:hypothetical protein